MFGSACVATAFMYKSTYQSKSAAIGLEAPMATVRASYRGENISHQGFLYSNMERIDIEKKKTRTVLAVKG